MTDYFNKSMVNINELKDGSYNMDNTLIASKKVYKQYLKCRKQILEYTNEDMNLQLDNDKQVYIALFDIPLLKIIYLN